MHMDAGFGAVSPGACLYTIGHSNHSAEHLVDLLVQHEIAAVADVRSVPRSGYSPQFDRVPLQASLRAMGIEYVFMGDALGGRPAGGEFYDGDDHVRYDLVAQADWFVAGIGRLLAGVGRMKVATLCSEENPCDCHRRLLVGKVVTGMGVELHHIRGDGRIEIETEVALPEAGRPMSLFEEMEPAVWRSVRSVSRNGRPNGFSAFSESIPSDG